MVDHVVRMRIMGNTYEISIGKSQRPLMTPVRGLEDTTKRIFEAWGMKL
jgi:hypothetical protein